MNVSVFCHSEIDDAGLPASVFRLLHHVARRDGPNGCWASIASIAACCRLNEKTAKAGLKLLRELSLISCEQRSGETNIYRVTVERWEARGKPRLINAPPPGSKKAPGVQMNGGQIEQWEEDQNEPLPRDQSESRPPSQNEPPKGSPEKGYNEGITHKEVHEVTASFGGAVEEIYKAYPRPDDQPRFALINIQNAVAKHGAEYVLERTKMFAEVVSNLPPAVVEGVSTAYMWFNRGFYLDDPATWETMIREDAQPCARWKLEHG